MILVRLQLRRHRMLITSWSVLLIALAGGTASAYQDTYPTDEQRRVAAELAQHNAASLLVYGELPDPGTPALMFGWEIGAIMTVLAAVMAVLVATALTRAAEDGGTSELVRSCGVGPRTPVYSALTIVALVAAVLTVGGTVAVGLNAGHVDAVTWPGAAAYGCVVGLTFLLVGVLTVVLAQCAPSAGGTRVLGSAAVAAGFAIRAVADIRQVDWLNWVSPLGLRATVRPFAGDRWEVLGFYLAVATALAWLALALLDRREHGAGLVRRRDRRVARLRIRSSFGLATRLARRSVLTWTLAVAGIGTLFAALGSGVVEQSRDGEVDGFLGSQLGTTDPVAGYFAYSGTVIGIVVSCFAVLCVLRCRQDEAGGLTDHVLATGVRRWAPLAAQLVVTGIGAAAILGTAGALRAVVAPLVIEGGADVAARAFAYTVGQWPSAMAMGGWTALLVGCWPRRTWLVWPPLVASATLAMLGRLLGVPRTVQDLGIFEHVPDVAAADADVAGLLVLLVVGAVAGLLGVAGMARRDVVT